MLVHWVAMLLYELRSASWPTREADPQPYPHPDLGRTPHANGGSKYHPRARHDAARPEVDPNPNPNPDPDPDPNRNPNPNPNPNPDPRPNPTPTPTLTLALTLPLTLALPRSTS